MRCRTTLLRLPVMTTVTSPWEALCATANSELSTELRMDEEAHHNVPPLVPRNWLYAADRDSMRFEWRRRVVPDRKSFSSKLVIVRSRLRTVDYSQWDPTYDICEAIPMSLAVVSSHPQALAVDLLSANSQVVISAARMVPAEAVQRPFHFFDEEASRCYSGPKISELSSSLHRCLLEYLRGLGVDPMFVEHVCQQTHYEEHQAYLRWLHRLAHFAHPAGR
jgi:hypothetical protein